MSSFVFQDGFGIFQHFAKTSMLAGEYLFLHNNTRSMLVVLYGFCIFANKNSIYVKGFLSDFGMLT